MTPGVDPPSKAQLPWSRLAWFGALVVACYAPVLAALGRQWDADPDMSHGFFVPLVAGFRPVWS